jgi:cell filamentation protein
MSRYTVHGDQGEFQPGSEGLVLRNRVGIVSLDEMNDLEFELLAQLYESILLTDFPNRVLLIEDIKSWHLRWLGNVYDWAGQERSVNMYKEGFAFAAAGQIPTLLAQFQKDCLDRWTPSVSSSGEHLVEAIAVTHVELILIHPFREGNGRLSRLLADVMAVQAGLEPLDYSYWDANKDDYISAIHQGMAMDYEPMKQYVRLAMHQSSAATTWPT